MATEQSLNDIYRTRTSRAYADLDDLLFDVLNAEGFESLAWVGGGCLDAPGKLPSGSVKDYGENIKWTMPSLVDRTEEDYAIIFARNALAERLIDEILKEEGAFPETSFGC